MKKLNQAIKSYLAISILFFLIIIIIPANHDSMIQYHLTSNQYHILMLLIMLPMAVIWFAGFYGYEQVEKYANSIKEEESSENYLQLAKAVKWLAWSLPLAATVSILLDSISNLHPGFTGADEIISTYFTLLLALVSFTILSRASSGLTEHSNIRISAIGLRKIIILFVPIGVIYTYYTVKKLSLHDNIMSHNLFHLPAGFVVVTIMIPYLIAWFSGLMSAIELVYLGQLSQGVLYKRALNMLALGITLLISGSVVSQYLTTIQPQPYHLVLNGILLITYIFRILIGIGFVLIALASIKLKKIEEV